MISFKTAYTVPYFAGAYEKEASRKMGEISPFEKGGFDGDILGFGGSSRDHGSTFASRAGIILKIEASLCFLWEKS